MALLCLQLSVLAFTADTRAECIIQVYNSNHKIGFSTELLYHSPTDIYKSAFSDKMGLGTRLRNYGTLGRVNSTQSGFTRRSSALATLKFLYTLL